MNAKSAKEQNQDCQRQYKSLDDCYGKIGISAVAAAVCHQGERPSRTETRYIVRESD